MTLNEFLITYEITLPARRALDFRPVQLNPNQLLTHPMFGECRQAITDGVHTIAIFVDGPKEVHATSLRVKSPGTDLASNPTTAAAAKPKVDKLADLLKRLEAGGF